MFIKHLFCVYYIPDTMLVTGWYDIRRFNKRFIEEKMIQIISTLVTLLRIVSLCQESTLSQVVAVLVTSQSYLPSLSYFSMSLRPQHVPRLVHYIQSQPLSLTTCVTCLEFSVLHL